MPLYKFLQREFYELGDYKIIPLREEDIQLIRIWRNDQMDVLRQQKMLSKEEQIKYYNDIVKKSFQEIQPEIILFSYFFNGTCIGYGGLTNVDWIKKNAEISFLLDTKRTKNSDYYSKDFDAFLKIIIDLSFKELKFIRIFTETYDIRPTHIHILEKNGFKLEKSLKQHIFINGSFVDSLIHGLTGE